MNNKSPNFGKRTEERPPRVYTMFTWLMVLAGMIALVVTLIVVGFRYFYYKNDRIVARHETQQRSLEQQKVEQYLQQQEAEIEQIKASTKARLTLARNKQDEALAVVRKTMASLDFTRGEVNQAWLRLTTLLTNTTGAKMSNYPDLVRRANNTYAEARNRLPEPDKMREQMLACRRIEQDLIDNLGKNYNPDETLLKASREIRANTQHSSMEAAEILQLIDDLERDLKTQPPVFINFSRPPTAADTLQEAFVKLHFVDNPPAVPSTTHYTPPVTYQFQTWTVPAGAATSVRR
jgi:Tfp pilus assembly protein PilX